MIKHWLPYLELLIMLGFSNPLPRAGRGVWNAEQRNAVEWRSPQGQPIRLLSEHFVQGDREQVSLF